MSVSDVRWRDHAASGEAMQQPSWAAFTTSDVAVEGPVPIGSNGFAHDLRLDIPVATPPGSYSFTVTYTAMISP